MVIRLYGATTGSGASAGACGSAGGAGGLGGGGGSGSGGPGRRRLHRAGLQAAQYSRDLQRGNSPTGCRWPTRVQTALSNTRPGSQHSSFGGGSCVDGAPAGNISGQAGHQQGRATSQASEHKAGGRFHDYTATAASIKKLPPSGARLAHSWRQHTPRAAVSGWAPRCLWPGPAPHPAEPGSRPRRGMCLRGVTS